MPEVSPAFEFPAAVEPVQLARVRPEITATLKAIHFSPGDMVEKGELLLEFDDANYRAEYEVAETNLQSAEAAMLEAGESWEQTEELMLKGYISQQDYDKARAAHDSARAALSSAKAKVTKSRLDLDRTHSHAPFGGTIMASIGGTILVPIFFRLVQGLREVVHGGPTSPPE